MSQTGEYCKNCAIITHLSRWACKFVDEHSYWLIILLLHLTDSAPVFGSYRHEGANPNMLFKLNDECIKTKDDNDTRQWSYRQQDTIRHHLLAFFIHHAHIFSVLHTTNHKASYTFTILISHAFLSRTWHVRPELCNLMAKSSAHLPVTDVSPSGLTSVIPSIGFSPFLGIAKYIKPECLIMKSFKTFYHCQSKSVGGLNSFLLIVKKFGRSLSRETNRLYSLEVLSFRDTVIAFHSAERRDPLSYLQVFLRWLHLNHHFECRCRWGQISKLPETEFLYWIVIHPPSLFALMISYRLERACVDFKSSRRLRLCLTIPTMNSK